MGEVRGAEGAPGDPEGDAVELMSELAFKRYLPDDNLVKVDRATMFHSIEVGEVSGQGKVIPHPN